MALLPKHSSTQRRLFAASKPDYKDFTGPPNGDYVRYVEELMTWAQQEQERMRHQALSDSAEAAADIAWGRSPAVPATRHVAKPVPVAKKPFAKPWEDWVRKVHTYARNVQLQAAEMATTAGEDAQPKVADKVTESPEKRHSLVIWLVGLIFVIWILADLFEF